MRVLTADSSRTYSAQGTDESVREGFNPDEPEAHNPEQVHNLDYPFTEEQDTEEQRRNDIKPPISEEAHHWQSRDYSHVADREDRSQEQSTPQYGSFHEERNAWTDH